MKLTIEHIIDLVDQLTKSKTYDYVSGGDNKAKLIGVNKSEQCIEIARVNADGSEKTSNMTKETLQKLCSKVTSNKPFKFDSVLDGGGNARSTFEAIFAHTTEFYACKVGRVKHLIWVPQMPHEKEQISDYETIKDKIHEQDVDFSTSLNPAYRPYITAIKSKPFLLLAGISGTGKSRIVRELARACWDEDCDEYKMHKPKNFEIIQVKPNWHDSSELLGYVSRVSGEPIYIAGDFIRFIASAWEDPEIPYFLCLDEMNLAPVEQYFAEYLSVIESRKANNEGTVITDPIIKIQAQQWYYNLVNELTSTEDVKTRFLREGICIPQNLIVIGTVNMDETTFSFSRKVLDRAMTIEMNDVDLYGGLTNRYEKIGKLSFNQLVGNVVEGADIYDINKEVCDIAISYLQGINTKLEGTPFKIAYRTRNEFLLYVVNNLPYNKNDEGEELTTDFVIARALDEITSMKILSRIEGDETKVSVQFLTDLEKIIKESLDTISKENFACEISESTHKSVSLAKLSEMKKRLSSGYTSFWS